MTKRLLSILTAAVAASGIYCCRADNTIAIKTNILYDALLNANIGAEVKLTQKWTVDVSGNYNGWTLSHGRQWKHWLIQPEARYWFRESMSGHFVAAHLFGGQFNTTLNGARRQGWAAGLGVGYGYTWRFGQHWGVEAGIAVGYARYSYDKYPCAQCGRKIAHRNRNYFGPTKAALNLVYYFGKSRKAVPEPEKTAVEIPPVEIQSATEVVLSPARPEFNFALVDVPHTRMESESISDAARIQYGLGKTDIDRNIGKNASELDAIITRLDSISNSPDLHLVSVKFTGYASPEGPYRSNEHLAFGRTCAIRDYVMGERQLPDSVITVNSVAEDWQGLRQAVAASDLPDKDILLSIIDCDLAPDAKESALKKRNASWTYIVREIFPELRRIEYLISYEHKYEVPESYTLEEVNKALATGNAAEATHLLTDIPHTPESDYARGVAAALQQRYDEAETWFVRAQAGGIDAASGALNQLKAKTNK